MKGFEQLREHLNKNGILHKWLADQMEITASHFSVILKGDRGLSKRCKKIILNLWPDLDLSDDPELLPEEQRAKDIQDAKNLFDPK